VIDQRLLLESMLTETFDGLPLVPAGKACEFDHVILVEVIRDPPTGYASTIAALVKVVLCRSTGKFSHAKDNTTNSDSCKGLNKTSVEDPTRDYR